MFNRWYAFQQSVQRRDAVVLHEHGVGVPDEARDGADVLLDVEVRGDDVRWLRHDVRELEREDPHSLPAPEAKSAIVSSWWT